MPNPGFGIGHATFDRFGPGWRNITVGGRLNGLQSCRNFNAYGFIHTSLVLNRVFAVPPCVLSMASETGPPRARGQSTPARAYSAAARRSGVIARWIDTHWSLFGEQRHITAPICFAACHASTWDVYNPTMRPSRVITATSIDRCFPSVVHCFRRIVCVTVVLSERAP